MWCLAMFSALELHFYVVFVQEKWLLISFLSFYMKVLLLLASAVIKEKYLILVLETIFLLDFSGKLWSKLRDSENS